MIRLHFSIGIILFGLTTGYILQLLIKANLFSLPIQIPTLRRGIQKAALWFFSPIPVVGAIWLIRINDLRIVTLPFIGVGILLTGGLLGWLVGMTGRCNRSQVGTLYCCGSFSNIASMGSLVSYLFIGEKGFALLTLFKMFEEIIYYGIGFQIARYYGAESDGNESFKKKLRQAFSDPFVIIAVGSLSIGGILNLSGIQRPMFYETLMAIFIPAGVVLLLVSIGLGLNLRRIGYLREVLLISGIKFVVLPLLAGIVSIFLGMKSIYGGLPMKAVLLGASMPVAFNAVVASSLYDLDLELANSCWLITTLGMVLVLPCLHFLLDRI